MSELKAGTYWVAQAQGTAVALVVETYWHDDTHASWGPAGVVMYGAVDSDRMRELSLSRLSLRLGGRPHLKRVDAPSETKVEELWRDEQAFRRVSARDLFSLSRHDVARAAFPAKGADESADEFYKRVAVFYLAASERTGKPLQAICEGAGVPKSTAARWAREARARGFLPETIRGKV